MKYTVLLIFQVSIPGIYEQLFHKYDPLNTSFISHHNYFDLLVDILVTAGHEDGQSLTKRENELMRLALERFVNEKKGDKFSYEEVVEDIDSKKMVQFVNEAFLEHFNEEYEGEEDEILEEEGDNKENIEKERKEKTNENTNEDGNKDDYQMKNNKEKEDHNKNNEEKIDENAGVEENINENVNKNKEKLEL